MKMRFGDGDASKTGAALLLTGILFLGSFFDVPAFAQGHAGHNMPPAAADKSKPQAVKPQPKAPAPQPEVEEAPQIELSPEQIQRIGVKTIKVGVNLLQKVIRTVGRIEVNERNQATVNTKIEGWIEKLYVDYTGRYVRKGERVAEIYSPELFAAQQEFLNAKKWAGQPAKKAVKNDRNSDHRESPSPVSDLQQMLAKDSAATLNAARQRLLLWDISERQIKKIEETGKPIRTLTLYSPVHGYVTQKMVVRGMKVMPGEKLFDVADFSSVWIVADIYEQDLSAIRVGQSVKIMLSSFPGRELSSVVDYIYPVVATETRTMKVRMTVPNPGNRLKPQMYANIDIRIGLGRRLTVPSSAVIDTGRGQVVYVDRGNGAFEPREIIAGVRTDTEVEVLRGLKIGDKVASSANFLIDSEAQLKGVKPLPRK